MKALLVLALLAAGCVAPASAPASAPAATFDIKPVGRDGGEPSLGVAKDGAIFYTGALVLSPEQALEAKSEAVQVLRSRDSGASWTPVGDALRDPKVDGDPWLWLDPVTDRVYHAPLDIACSWAEWSDDGGESWDFNPAIACAPPGHDHPKLVTGPPAQGVATQGYPSVVYYAYNSLLVPDGGLPLPTTTRLGTLVAVSLDGGKSFGTPVVAHASDCHRGIVGPPAVAPDGTAFIPKGTCDGLDIITSRDSGQSWSVVSLNGEGALDDFAFDPGVAVDAAGVAYAVWPGRDALLHLARSEDGGRSWSAPEAITPPGVTATVFSSIVAGAEGKVAIAYASTTRDPSGWPQRDSSVADDATMWNLHVAVIDHGRIATRDVTTDADPLQRGCIWMRGGQDAPCRNLADFVTLTQRDGRLYLAYTDGCDACADAKQSDARHLMLAVSRDAPLR